MAKQSFKQQVIQQITDKAVQQAMSQKREQEMAQLQADYNAWKTQQDGIAQLQAEYDAWKSEQPIQQATVNEVKAVEKPRDIYLDRPGDKYDKKKAAEAISKRQAFLEDRREKQKEQIPSLISYEDYFRQQQNENMLASPKEKGIQQLVNLTEYQDKINKAEKKAKEDKNRELEQQILNADKYNTKSTQLTDEQRELEKQILNADKYQVNESSPEESRRKLSAFGWGVTKIPFLASELLANGIVDAGETLGQAGANVLDDLTGHHEDHENLQKVNDYWDAKREQVEDNIKWMHDSQRQSEEENPFAYGAGKMATQAALYTLTNPLFDKLGAAVGGSKAAGFVGNQIGQNLQDVALDTLPRYKELKDQGVPDDEIIKILEKEGAYNAAGNLVMGGIGEIPNLARSINEKQAARQAFTDNIVEGRKALDAIINEDADNIVRSATKQAEDIAPNNIPSTEELRELEREANTIDEIEDYSRIWKREPAEDISKSNIPEEIEDTAKTQRPEYPEDVQEKIASDFEEIYRGMDNMNQAAIDSKNAKVMEKFEKLQKSVFDYENKIWKSSDAEEINNAKKAADAARQSFIREMKKVDPNYKGDLTGTKLGNAQYRIPKGISDEEAEELVNDWVKQDLENPNRFVEDVSKRNTVMAEDAGLNPKSSEPETFINEDTGLNPELKEVDNVGRPGKDSFVETWEQKERGQSRHIRNDGTPMKMEDVADEVVADFEDNPDMYTVLKNADTKAKAERIYAEADNPEIEFRDMLRNHDPAALPLGHQLAKDYSAAGNHEAAAQIYREMGEQLTKSGQFSQAAAINMMKNDPLTALNYAERQLDKLNENGAKQFGDKWKDFSLTDDEIKMFNNIAPGDEEAIKAAYDAIGERLGKEYPTTFMDKLLEGRKIAMLFNVRTNVRNIGANVPTLGLRWASDRVEAIGQNIAHLINPEIKVTQSVTGSGKQGRKLAREVFNDKKVQAMLKNQSGKYEIPELRNSLVQNKQMYKGTALSKWIDRVTGNGIQKVNEKLFGKKGVQSGLETIRNATYKMLDLGDSPFIKENFIERLGSYIHAQGIKDIKDIPDEAIQTAWEEAMKATYKDNSWAVQMLSGLKSGIEKIPGVGKPLSQAAIPFLQAPGNIAARMIDYSPIKATKGIADIISGSKANNVKKVSQGIEEAAKGLTGSGLILLGMRLRDSGIITGTYSEDKDQKAYEKQTGFKEFALHVGDKYFTYDWAQPFAEPLIIGTLLSDAINKSDEYDSDLLDYFGVENPIAKKALGVAYEGGKASLNSWFNASPLQGLQELLSGGFNGTDIAQNIVNTGVSDFAGAFVPASVNAVAKSMDTTQRNTYDPSNKVSTFVNQQIAKIPKLSETLPAKYDTWGREMKYADSKAMATASRFIVPGDYSYDKSDKIDKEIMRLYEGTKGDATVFPQVAPNKVGDKKLNNKEVSEYQKDMGTRSRQLAEEFINSDVYKDMEDADRVEVLSNMYGASKTITERDKFDKEPAESSRYKRAIEAYDNAGGGEKGVKAMVDYFTAKAVSDEAGLDADSNAAKAIQKDVQDGNMEAAQQKKDAAQQLPTLGLDKPGPTYTYYNAQKNIPNLTVEEFAKTYKSIDSNSNQGIAQDEIINYLNRQHISSESEAKKIWNAYGKSDWKSIPSLQNGTWKKKKK